MHSPIPLICLSFYLLAASLHRLRFAFAYSAQKLKQIFTLPGENMGAALEKFFFSTLERNGKGERADVGVPVAPFGTVVAHNMFSCIIIMPCQ